MRILLRMERSAALEVREPPTGVAVVGFDAGSHHDGIRFLYGRAFDDDPWPADWDRFDEFDPAGVFVAVAGEIVGFAICFRRHDFGYISVVAVDPNWRRQGVASALVGSCARRLRSLGLEVVRIDAYEDSPTAVRTYESLGFEVYDVVEEPSS